MSTLARKSDNSLERWAIKQQICYVMSVQKLSRQRLYRMLLIGSVGIPAYLISAYKLSGSLDKNNDAVLSSSILTMIVISPFIVSVFYLLYVSERDAGHKYGLYLRQQMRILAPHNLDFVFWENWVESERQSNDNYRYDVQRSLAIIILMSFYYLISSIFGVAAFVKIMNEFGYFSAYLYMFSLLYAIYGWSIIKYSRSMPKKIRDALLS